MTCLRSGGSGITGEGGGGGEGGDCYKLAISVGLCEGYGFQVVILGQV